MKSRALTLLSAVLFICAALPVWAANGNQIRDEWEPIDRIVVSTLPDKKLITFVEKIVGAAVKAGVRVVIVDDDPASQAAILTSLKNQKLVTDQNSSYVQFTNTPHNTAFARDEAVIVSFDSKTGNASFTATDFAPDGKPSQTTQILADIGKALNLPTKNIPTVTYPPGSIPPSAPLTGDGGDWMTTNSGKTLITTTTFYEQNGGAEQVIKDSVNETLKKAFGITQVIELEPLNKTASGYNLTNAHVDLQVRTLPGNKVIVASVPVGDPQHDILNLNAQKLQNAGFQVIRLENAPQGGTQFFKTYTNSLFLNGTLVIPSYNDPARDQAAKQAYDQALNNALPPNDKRRYTIVQIDASLVIQGCGAARCAAREIPRLPSKKENKEAGSKTPKVSFDAATGLLSFTQDVINFLGSPGDELTDPRFATDPLLGSTIEISDMILNLGMSVADRFAFVGGTLRVHKDSLDLLNASLPVFSIYGTQPDGALDMFAVLNDITMAPMGTSAWLDAFRLEVIDRPPLLPDFFVSSPVDLIALSNGFKQSFSDVQLSRVGVTGNGSPVPEPSSLMLICLGLGVLVIFRRKVSLRQIQTLRSGNGAYPLRTVLGQVLTSGIRPNVVSRLAP